MCLTVSRFCLAIWMQRLPTFLYFPPPFFLLLGSLLSLLDPSLVSFHTPSTQSLPAAWFCQQTLTGTPPPNPRYISPGMAPQQLGHCCMLLLLGFLSNERQTQKSVPGRREHLGHHLNPLCFPSKETTLLFSQVKTLGK